MSSSDSLPKPRFRVNQIVCERWKILREIGRGGCGVVVSVEHLNDCSDTSFSSPTDNSERQAKSKRDDRPSSQQSRSSKTTSNQRHILPLIAAMKAEAVDPKGRYAQTIKMEVNNKRKAHVLRRLQHSEHFCRLYLVCQMDAHTNVLIMSLVGRSLSWLRRRTPRQQFTPSTVIRASLQCLNAIQEVHRQGFLHRDIKGSNFAIGNDPQNCRIIHLLDFGFARVFLREKKGRVYMRPARPRAPFLGTARYCSINMHEGGEHGRVDDLWSFLYMMVELLKGKLPWRDIPHQRLLRAKKFYADYLLNKCPIEFKDIMNHLEMLTWNSRPNYELIRRALELICVKNGFSVTHPFDWENGGCFYARIRKAETECRRNSLSSWPTESTTTTGTTFSTSTSSDLTSSQ
ncbi:Protein kinase domain-containing protein [Aphelenchoides besseyi]|nr:Protein kinase domain-containing protein [Aphelenchoides besseyi]KAI6230976.1 Protein kinase domain-containing protein [Aphelenchoides besseyi]